MYNHLNTLIQQNKDSGNKAVVVHNVSDSELKHLEDQGYKVSVQETQEGNVAVIHLTERKATVSVPSYNS